MKVLAWIIVCSTGLLSSAAWGEEESKVLTNSIGMKLVRIPAGTFVMGSSRREPDRDDKEERHEVRITKPFFSVSTKSRNRSCRPARVTR